MTVDEQKQAAAHRALDFVNDGMVVGLGTGSTADHFVKALGKHVSSGLSVHGVATSLATESLARECNIPLVSIDDVERIDVTVDGADEVDRDLRLIKGGGGALLREKIVAHGSARMVVIVDEGKLVPQLGAFPLPVEIVQFAALRMVRQLAEICEGATGKVVEVSLRKSAAGELFITDGGHYIADCACAAIPQPGQLAAQIERVPGVVEHGLFLKLATDVIVGHDNSTELLSRMD